MFTSRFDRRQHNNNIIVCRISARNSARTVFGGKWVDILFTFQFRLQFQVAAVVKRISTTLATEDTIVAVLMLGLLLMIIGAVYSFKQYGDETS